MGWSVAVAGTSTVLVGVASGDEQFQHRPILPVFAYDDRRSGQIGWIWVDEYRCQQNPTIAADQNYSRRVTGLTNDQLYVYRVRAVNAAGNTPSR